MKHLKLKNLIKTSYLIIVMINYHAMCSQNNYSDIQSMLLDIEPFEYEIEPGFLNVKYVDERVSTIDWFDQDSVKFTKI